MKIIITGGDGFVGRHLCNLLSLNHEVHLVDNFRFGLHRKLFHRNSKYIVHECDIRDFKAIHKIISELMPDIVFHLAAVHFIPECEKYPDLAISTNVIGTVNLAKTLIRTTRLIFVSSGAVYSPDVNPHSEDNSPIKPSDIYGLTKLHGEQYVNYLSRERGFIARIVRLFNVIGPGETNPHVLPEIMAQLMNGKRKLVLGNIKPRRDYIYVKDVIEGLSSIGLSNENTISSGEVINLGSSKHFSVEEIVNMLGKIVGDKIVIEIDSNRIRKTDRPIMSADISKLKKLIGWEPKYSIKQELENIWKNPDLSDKILKGVSL
ncbi:MAG: hypothetical protein A2V65_01660 [Deltaproteobacteria bacterium RBG_13_49_15]|nr:MAG: hypothetical protein A2V65_01660 [Deltaproteobacteria bacterium RBG_13_49_15]